MYPKETTRRDLQTHDHSSKKTGATKCPSMNDWVHKVWYTHTLECHSAFKGRTSDICYDMSEPWGHTLNWTKPVAKRQILYDSTYEVPRVAKFTETEVERGLPGDRLWDLGRKVQFQFCKMQRGSVEPPMWVDLILLNSSLRNDLNGQFYVVFCMLPQQQQNNFLKQKRDKLLMHEAPWMNLKGNYSQWKKCNSKGLYTVRSHL